MVEVVDQLEPTARHQETVITFRFYVPGNGFDFFHPDSRLSIAILEP